MADDENLEYFEDEEEEDTKQIANNYNEGQEDFMNDNDIEKEIQNELEEMKENKDDL